MNSLCRVSPTKTELLFTYLWASSTRIRLQRVCAGVDIVTCEGSCACSSRVNAGMPACACDVRTKSTVVEVGPSRASRPIWQAGSVLSRCRARSKQDSESRSALIGDLLGGRAMIRHESKAACVQRWTLACRFGRVNSSLESRTGAVSPLIGPPFPVPAHGTGQADLPHPGFFGQSLAKQRPTVRVTETEIT